MSEKVVRSFVKTYVLSIAVGNAPNSHLLHECESGAKFLERAVEWLGIENRKLYVMWLWCWYVVVIMVCLWLLDDGCYCCWLKDR